MRGSEATPALVVPAPAALALTAGCLGLTDGEDAASEESTAAQAIDVEPSETAGA